MRREGFELTIGKPRVVFRTGDNGTLLEPIEEVIIDVDSEHSGIVVQKLSERRAELLEMRPSGGGRTRLVFHAPTRGLIGYQSELLSDTRGTAVFNRLFHEYAPYRGDIPGRRNGVLISNGQGDSTDYALWYLEDRGALLIDPGVRVYEGMIVGEHSRGNDLEVNVLKGKQLSNVRAAGKEEKRAAHPADRRLSLEAALAYIGEDELVEVTPKSIRLRKSILDPHGASAPNAPAPPERLGPLNPACSRDGAERNPGKLAQGQSAFAGSTPHSAPLHAGYGFVA